MKRARTICIAVLAISLLIAVGCNKDKAPDAKPAPAASGQTAPQEKAEAPVNGAPTVVSTSPANGENAVDAVATTEIRVTFSKEMNTQQMWSWVTDPRNGEFPKIIGEVKYIDKRTCVAPVKLEPGKKYAIRFNSDKYRNFKDESGAPAEPYLLVFQTK